VVPKGKLLKTITKTYQDLLDIIILQQTQDETGEGEDFPKLSEQAYDIILNKYGKLIAKEKYEQLVASVYKLGATKGIPLRISLFARLFGVCKPVQDHTGLRVYIDSIDVL
jgi:hypothetical protein